MVTLVKNEHQNKNNRDIKNTQASARLTASISASCQDPEVTVDSFRLEKHHGCAAPLAWPKVGLTLQDCSWPSELLFLFLTN